jgi:high-affinity iron transporter
MEAGAIGGILLIVFREVLEAGLVVGVVLAATEGVPRRSAWIAAGIMGGIAGSCVVALFARQLDNLFQGSGQETFNAAILILAVAMLAWHNAWMASHGRELAQNLKAVGLDVAAGRRPITALAIVCFVAVMREGSEVVLFLAGPVIAGNANVSDLIEGGALGLLSGAIVSALLYRGLITIPVRYLFRVLTGLITLLAAGLAAQAANFLQQGGWIDLWSDQIWDTSSLLAQDNPLGQILHVLVGYTAQPTGLQLVVYIATIVVMIGLIRVAGSRSGHAPQKASAHS